MDSYHSGGPFLLQYQFHATLSRSPKVQSYFNELAGGAENGHEHLLDSGSSWGQDLLYVKEWQDANLRAKPFYLAAFSLINPSVAGIVFEAPFTVKMNGKGTLGPGWYAIDVNYLRGSTRPYHVGPNRTSRVVNADDFAVFRSMTPVGRIAYSYLVYHVRESA